MSTESDLKNIKTATETAQKAASKINAWAKQAKELAEKGKELSEIQAVLKGVNAFGKASAVLGVAAGGMEMVIKIVGGPSPQDKIMSMIKDLSAKIGQILIHADHIAARQKAHEDLVNAKDQIWPHLEFIKILMGHIEEIQTGNEKDKEQLINNVLKHYDNPDLIDDAVMQIADLIEQSEADQNVLRASYIATYGDPNSISKIATSLLMAAVDASIAYGFVAKLQFQNDRAPGLLSPEAMGEKFQPQIDRISRATGKYTLKCWNESEKNIKNRLEKEELLEKLDVSKYQQASDKLCRQLSDQWYMYDWLTIVYPPVGGYDNHGVTGGDHRIDRFRQRCLNNAQANIIMAWTTKGTDGYTSAERDTIEEFLIDSFSGVRGSQPPRLFPTGLINPQRVLEFRPSGSRYEKYKGFSYYFRFSRSYALKSDTRAFLAAWPDAAPFESLLWAGPRDHGKTFSRGAIYLSISKSTAVPQWLAKTVLENAKYLQKKYYDLYRRSWDIDAAVNYKHQYSYIVFRQFRVKAEKTEAEKAAEKKRQMELIRDIDLDL